MKFIDECKIEVTAGKGGNGIVSFRREAKVPRGGPDGGDGGNGGSVYFLADKGINTLLNIKYLRHIVAQDGENGRTKNQYGANGKDVYVKVPYGTLIYHDSKMLYDIVLDKPYLIAKGGKGGRGNTKFKSSLNTAPRLSENGLRGEHYKLHLVLKILADIGFVGLPSAGKSTILSKISNAKPKIADYDFTTLVPQLGLVKAGENSFVVADLPGLIKGAAQGKGLGHDFLKHIERCKVIAHIIDFGTPQKNPIEDYKQIRHELTSYSLALDQKSEIIIANKSDLSAFDNNLKNFKTYFPQLQIIPISALTNSNLQTLKYKLYELLVQENEIKTLKPFSEETTITLENDSKPFEIKKVSEHKFVVTGQDVSRLEQLIPLNTPDNIMRFNKLLKGLGVWKELKTRGIKNGDIVQIYSYELEWNDEE